MSTQKVPQNPLQINKDQTNFLHLCKDLFKFIKKHIIKRYILVDSNNTNDLILPLTWSYNSQEKVYLTKKDKACDIFKDDDFLILVQKCYESLGNVIEKMDENRKNLELMKKDIELGEKSMKLLSELNSQLNQYFDKNNMNTNNNNPISIEDNKLLGHLNLAKSVDILSNLNIINNINELNSMNNNNNINDTKNKENNDITNTKNNLSNNNTDNNINVLSSNKITFLGKKKKLNNKNNNLNNIINKKEENNTFDKILKTEFSGIYASSSNNIKLPLSKELFVKELNKLINKLSNSNIDSNSNDINFNKFEKPVLIGSHKVFDIKYLLDSIPGIDILIKCKEIKNLSEIEMMKENIMNNELNLESIEICKAYDKYSEIIKITNKCKIKIMKEIFYIYVNLFFVDISNMNYLNKEKFVNYYMFNEKGNKMYENENEILLGLFFRRWRRKFNLFFIMPELFDIIIDYYYKKNGEKNIKNIIDNIFYDLLNEKVDLYGIKKFINDWYTIKENKEMLFKAINTSNDYLLKNDVLNLVKCA